MYTFHVYRIVPVHAHVHKHTSSSHLEKNESGTHDSVCLDVANLYRRMIYRPWWLVDS